MVWMLHLLHQSSTVSSLVQIMHSKVAKDVAI
jgi:hypothetical protein